MDPYKAHLKKMKSNNKKIRATKSRLRKKKKKSNFPVGVVIYSVLIAAGAWFGINHLDQLDQLDKVLSKVNISFFGKTMAQTSSENKENNATSESLKREVSSVQPRSELTPVTEAAVKKDVNYFKMLEEKEDVLKLKEESLKKLETNLQQEKEELLVKIKELEQLRADISLSLKDKVDTDKKTVDNLVQVYANMKPKSAAPVLETMNEELAVKILHNMKKKNAAAILNVINAERAKFLTEKIAGYQE